MCQVRLQYDMTFEEQESLEVQRTVWRGWENDRVTKRTPWSYRINAVNWASTDPIVEKTDTGYKKIRGSGQWTRAEVDAYVDKQVAKVKAKIGWKVDESV